MSSKSRMVCTLLYACLSLGRLYGVTHDFHPIRAFRWFARKFLMNECRNCMLFPRSFSIESRERKCGLFFTLIRPCLICARRAFICNEYSQKAVTRYRPNGGIAARSGGEKARWGDCGRRSETQSQGWHFSECGFHRKLQLLEYGSVKITTRYCSQSFFH